MLQTGSRYIAEGGQHFRMFPAHCCEHNPQPPYAIDLWDNATGDPLLKVNLVEHITPRFQDDYFTPTTADLKLAQSGLIARTQALNDAPLQLRTVSEAAAKSKRDRWPNTTIRIRFTDRTQLEKVFPSSSKIRSVYAFVRESLREDVKPVKFVLYQPPKRDLKVSDPAVRDLSLSDLYLAPSSVLLLRFEDAAHPDQARALNGNLHRPRPPRPEMLAQAIELPAAPAAASASASTSSTPGGLDSVAADLKNGLNNLEKKMPKWMKMGLKK
ncbi:hypothetical protein B0H14DRAFT_3882465 [Mycena olivaceomarginata]|nr:hypothetical protein B0H14DRAFT_3882465 [Mycena olivaceomarginata]